MTLFEVKLAGNWKHLGCVWYGVISEYGCNLILAEEHLPNTLRQALIYKIEIQHSRTCCLILPEAKPVEEDKLPEVSASVLDAYDSRVNSLVDWKKAMRAAEVGKGVCQNFEVKGEITFHARKGAINRKAPRP
ncbi:hypothetical protein PTKIN_Ptkin02bG0143000 [Pterospermum kingtungense]